MNTGHPTVLLEDTYFPNSEIKVFKDFKYFYDVSVHAKLIHDF